MLLARREARATLLVLLSCCLCAPAAGGGGGSFGGGGFGGSGGGAVCSSPPPPEAALANISQPTSIVGSGSPEGCTFAALDAAVREGGVVVFACGAAPVTILLSASLLPPVSNGYANETALAHVIDGGGLVTLDGGNAVRIISWLHGQSFQHNNDTLTLQRLRLVRGRTTPTQAIPPCPPKGNMSNAACSTGFDDGEGGAVLVRDGSLRIIECELAYNQAALLGPDTGGGAVYISGALQTSFFVRSAFVGNTASNAGAIGLLWAGAVVIDSVFDGNAAVGFGANNNDPSKCSCINNGQNEVGSGGNGGAIYKDGGDGRNLVVCGAEIRNTFANEFGCAIFLTDDGTVAKLVLADSILVNNSERTNWQWCPGVSTDNPHEAGSGASSPSPVNTTFCDSNGACTSTCAS
jgi:hypothetical protein